MRKKYNEEGKLMNDPFAEMYEDVTNPERIEENKHKNDVKNMKEQKKIDTGL